MQQQHQEAPAKEEEDDAIILSSMPLLPISSPMTITKCKRLQTKNGDIWIASYPKSGTTWLQNIIYQLLTKAQDELSHISDYTPFFEVDQTWSQNSQEPIKFPGHERLGRRIFNTHLRWDMMPGTSSIDLPGRYLYIIRDPRDAVVSYYHHLLSMIAEDGGFEGEWDSFWEEWIQGKIAFGSWVDHVVSWEGGPASKDPRVLFLHYEDLKRDLRKGLKAIAHHCQFSLDEEDFDNVESRCTFEYMSQNIHLYEPRSVTWRKKSFRFIRKGQIGDHHSYFTSEQAKQLRRLLAGKFGGELHIPSYITNAFVDGLG